MNVARYDFACAEVDGLVYVAGGYGVEGSSLSSVEVYNPDINKWTLTESLRQPRWGCFACGFEGKLYVMGGRSSFTIGNSKYVYVYNPESNSWCEMKNGCVMVTAHAMLGKKLFSTEWKNQRKVYPSHAFENREIVVILTTSIAVLIGCVVVLVWRKSGTQKKPSTFVPPKPLIVMEVEPGGAKV
ncbi:hypothetical protein MLD38_002390 [Melastoma candidum]|uniref:Uncharacterized protein n=1 Tax=Melastoma candidum TaxID=119954 RepID=A0ACB9RZ64_9MYRT|nr:hypothetical protein MLD38_002390 [Melastoma candidum]